MDCPICTKLMALFEETERHYAQAIFALTSIRETGTAEEYITLRRVTDEARLDSESARLEIEAHKLVHSKAN